MLSVVSSHVSLRSSASMRSFQTLQDDDNSSTETVSFSQRTASTSSPRTRSTGTNTSSSSSFGGGSRAFIPSPPPLSHVSGNVVGGDGGSSPPHIRPPLHTVVLQPDAAPYAQLCFNQQLNTMTALLVGKCNTSLLEQHQQEQQLQKQQQQQQQQQQPVEVQNQEIAVDTADPTWQPFGTPNLTWSYSSEEDSGWSTGSSSLGDDSSEADGLPQGIVWLDRHWLFDEGRANDDHRALLLHDGDDDDDSSGEFATGENGSKSSSGTTTVSTRCGRLVRRGICTNIKKEPSVFAAHPLIKADGGAYGGKSYAYTSLGG